MFPCLWRKGLRLGCAQAGRQMTAYFRFGKEVDETMQAFADTSLSDSPDTLEADTLSKYHSLQRLPMLDPSSLLQPYLQHITAQVHKIVPST